MKMQPATPGWETAPHIQRLAWGLTQPIDPYVVINNFDQGHTEFGDVSLLTAVERDAVLDRVTSSRPFEMDRDGWASIAPRGLAFALSERSVRGGFGRPDVGMWLLRDVQRDLENGREGAACFDDLLHRELGQGAVSLLQEIESEPHRDHDVNGVLTNIVDQIVNTLPVAHYLAERSVVNERVQRRRLGVQFEQARRTATALFLTTAAKTGLRPEYQQLALERINRLQLGAANRLEAQSNRFGVYHPGQLRLNIYPEEMDLLRKPNLLQHSLVHEAFHGSSAQDPVQRRTGLTVKTVSEQGVEILGDNAEEALADFLSLQAMGIDISGNAEDLRCRGIIYTQRVAAMRDFNEQYPQLFHHIFNAYYGQVDSMPVLVAALAVFYSNLHRQKTLPTPRGRLAVV